ncbi:MAG TPA: TIR domain-containing protein, partial [Caldimonas sp.]
MVKQVFISYRRDDSALTATVLYDALRARADLCDVFMDVEGIGYGDDFVAVINAELDKSDLVLVVVGPQWSEMLEARRRGDDWVRHEVTRALELAGGGGGGAAKTRRLRVLPILISGASPPRADELPKEIAALAHLSMVTFDPRARKASVNTLLEAIQGESFEDTVQRQKAWTRVRIASAAAGVALFLAGWLGVLDFFGIDTRIASATMLVAGLAPPPAAWSGEVVLVGIDADSERAIGRKFDASWRAEHATLIANAASASARTVAFDIVLEDAGNEAANAALQGALAATRDKMPVVFGVQRKDDSGAGLMLAQFAPLARRG